MMVPNLAAGATPSSALIWHPLVTAERRKAALALAGFARQNDANVYAEIEQSFMARRGDFKASGRGTVMSSA